MRKIEIYSIYHIQLRIDTPNLSYYSISVKLKEDIYFEILELLTSNLLQALVELTESGIILRVASNDSKLISFTMKCKPEDDFDTGRICLFNENIIKNSVINVIEEAWIK